MTQLIYIYIYRERERERERDLSSSIRILFVYNFLVKLLGKLRVWSLFITQ